jgi:delta 1-pyrroline-5-carboxylate dehydrogenase
MSIIQDETFGPVIPIMKVKNADEALRVANDSRYGLDAIVFTRDSAKAWQMAQRLHTGTVCINDGLVNYIIPDAPMGGVKDSGFSRRHGPEGIRKYCYQKTIVIDRFGMKNEMPWFPSSRKKTAQMRRIISLLWRSGWRNKLRSPGGSRRKAIP